MLKRDCVGESEVIDFLDGGVADEPTEALARGIMVTQAGTALLGRYNIVWCCIKPSDDYNGTYRIIIHEQ